MTLNKCGRKHIFGLMIGFVLATSAEKAQAEMEEVVVTGVAIVVSWYFPNFSLELFVDMLTGMFDEVTPEGPSVEVPEAEDFAENHENTSCSSSVETRADFATGAAGFAPVGTIFWVEYPAGGLQAWIVNTRSLSAYTVKEYSTCN